MSTQSDLRPTPPFAPVRFSIDDANRAADSWGLNCGPSALAAVTGKTPDEIRPFLGDFEEKHYTNPTLMFASLDQLGARWRKCSTTAFWPNHGLVRVQWEGPWTAPGVPMRVRYRKTHWVAAQALTDGPARDHKTWIFDINCMSVGGWVPFREWSESVVPWILRELVPKADGRWHMTHVIEVEPPAVREVAQ